MNRIETMFAEYRRTGRKALVGYLTGGDPDMARSEQDIREALKSGVDILELGVPFSDPTADGPTIQEASQRALAAGADVSGILGMVKRLRADFDNPIVLFGYANPLFAYGYDKVCADAAAAGADGMLVVDLPCEEAPELTGHMSEHDLVFIPLIAPTTPKPRMAAVLKNARGFVYYIMVTGVTGTRSTVAAGIAEHIAQIRECTELPVAVGFGVGTGEQARDAARAADAVVVGSALIRAAREDRLAEFVRELHSGISAT